MKNQKKIVLVTVPRMSPSPATGVWLLRESLLTNNIDADVYDANLSMHQLYMSHARWKDIECWGIYQDDLNTKDLKFQQIIYKILEEWTTRILLLSPSHVGISVFTYESRLWTQWLCYFLRKSNSSVKILLGGRGISDPGKSNAVFAENMISWQLADDYFNGEAEHELLKYMQDQPCMKNVVDHFHIVDNLDRKEFIIHRPEKINNYNLINNWYEGKDSPSYMDVTFDNRRTSSFKTYSTRGCIKTCTFCDVHLLRPKFSIRSAQNLFDEIRYAIEHYNFKHVFFTDEMINGSNKQFLTWTTMLAKYLDNNNIKDFSWSAQFGIKSKKSTPVEMFALISATGGQCAIGVDHFSDQILEHMNKKYTSEDIFWYMDNFKKNPMLVAPCQMVANYPTETLQDFELQKQGFQQLVNYKEIIDTIDLGTGCGIPQGSMLANLPGMTTGSSDIGWIYDKNPQLTQDEKLRRRHELDDWVESLGFVNRKKRTYWTRINSWAKTEQ
jgi:Radical SAM superfamily